MKTARCIALLGALAAALPSAASASGYRSYKVCGGDSFATCAAVSINVVGSDVTVRLWNLSGNGAATYGHGASTYAGTIFNGIGFYNTQGVSAVLGSLKVTGPLTSGGKNTGWKLANNANVNFGVDFRTQPLRQSGDCKWHCQQLRLAQPVASEHEPVPESLHQSDREFGGLGDLHLQGLR